MNDKERVKLVFETISKVAGFEIKPDKGFYIVANGYKHPHKLDEDLELCVYDEDSNDYFHCRYYDFLSIFRGDWKFEEIKEKENE